MRPKPASLLLFSFFAVTSLGVASLVTAEPVNRNIFTLQVGSFPDLKSAQEFASRLTQNDVHAVCGTVELPGRGVWNRVLVGLFRTFGEARSQGENLVARGLIQEFLVKQIDEGDRPDDRQPQATSPRGDNSGARQTFAGTLSYARVDEAELAGNLIRLNASRLESKGFRRADASKPGDAGSGALRRVGPDGENRPRWVSARRENETSEVTPRSRAYSSVDLLFPKTVSRDRWLATSTNMMVATASIPKPDPIRVALDIVAGKWLPEIPSRQGGLWLSGDTAEALARLRWIVGGANADLIGMNGDGKLVLDLALLARLTRVDKGGATNTMRVVDYVASNDGLLLLVELTQGPNRYLLHLGPTAPTAGSPVRVAGSINLDNNFDSRINPYRRQQRKLEMERPPQAFDALIAMNPQARWFNLPANRFVPVGHITFHELAEAHAKVQLGLDYLVHEPRAGAHNLAIERERLLKLQRPFSDVVVTAGSNRVLKLGEEMRRFYREPRRSIAGFK